jgi:hypothetical protein
MEIYLSIDGVLRNTIQKFDYHYRDAYLDSEFESENNFEYKIIEPIHNDNLLSSYQFQSSEELEYFLYVEYPIEIFGHAGISYQTTFTDLNKIIYENPEHNFTVVGLNELGKSKPATLFFLSKNGFLGNNIKFIKSKDISEEWNACDVWITDSKEIIDLCPDGKETIKFNTTYNQHFTHKKEISKLTEIKETWLKFLENSTTSISKQLPQDVGQETQ